MKRSILTLGALMLLWTAPAFATFSNPTAVTRNRYTAVKATSTAASVASSAVRPLTVMRLEMQNQCGSDVYVQFAGGTAVAGATLDIPAGQTRIWMAKDGLIPAGPYSFITASATCTPDTNTGLSVLEAY